MKKLLNQDYIDRILGPAADRIVDELGSAYEALGSTNNDPTYFRGKIIGLQAAWDILRDVAKNLPTSIGDED